jgi:hypothetical protein
MTTITKPPTIDVVRAAELFGIGRSGAYEAAARGELTEGVPVLRIGSRYRVPVAAIERVLGVDLADLLDTVTEDANGNGDTGKRQTRASTATKDGARTQDRDPNPRQRDRDVGS